VSALCRRAPRLSATVSHGPGGSCTHDVPPAVRVRRCRDALAELLLRAQDVSRASERCRAAVPGVEVRCSSVELRRRKCGRRDSNPHRPVSETGASARLRHTRGVRTGTARPRSCRRVSHGATRALARAGRTARTPRPAPCGRHGSVRCPSEAPAAARSAAPGSVLRRVSPCRRPAGHSAGRRRRPLQQAHQDSNPDHRGWSSACWPLHHGPSKLLEADGPDRTGLPGVALRCSSL
jgi:hypothetical protein